MALSDNHHQPTVLLDGAGKRYGELDAVAPLSLSVAPGETIALLGPSGSGKTTLLRLISGTLEPSSGRVFLNGKELSGMRPGRELARLVGMIPQQFDLVPHLSAIHNVLAGRLAAWSTAKSILSLLWPQDRNIAVQALGRVGVGDRAHMRAGLLSGGEQQRVAIARVLVQDPEIILADEPVASLDPARADEIMALLMDVTKERGKTLVASMHSLALARKYCSRLVGLRNGVVQFDAPSEQVTQRMLDALYDLQGLRGESAPVPLQHPIPELPVVPIAVERRAEQM